MRFVFKSLILAHSFQPAVCMVELDWLTAHPILLAWKINAFPDTSAYSASILISSTCQASWKNSTEKKKKKRKVTGCRPARGDDQR